MKPEHPFVRRRRSLVPSRMLCHIAARERGERSAGRLAAILALPLDRIDACGDVAPQFVASLAGLRQRHDVMAANRSAAQLSRSRIAKAKRP